GAWGAAPAAHLGLSLPVTARRIGLALAWLPGAGRRGTATALPTCIDDTTGCYFRPDGGDRLFYGVSCDPEVESGRDVAPLRSPEVTAAGQRLARRVRGAATLPVIGTRAGFDGYTPDKHPIIGPAGPDGLYLALGFSGGGFKIAPAVAELAAAEITGEGRHSLLNPYRQQRFAKRELVTTSTAYDHM
ncbi:MAG: FAD-dependent oxidoreductase, partial [Trebonia sp.]